MNGKNTSKNEDSYQYVPDAEQIELENRILKETVQQLQREVERLHEPALMVCEVSEILDSGAIIRVQNGNQFFVNVSSTAKDILPGDTVLCEQKNLTILRKTSKSKQFDVEKFLIVEKPSISWSDIGGLADQIREIKEVVELPLLEPELFRKVGIDPPRGVLLHGPPGTGKTLLGKAVAAATNSTFIEIVGSELVQKFIGEGAKQIKEIFSFAREKAPAVIFIDELDSIAAKRIEIGTSGEREVQRTFMQLLAEIDGFETLGNVKIIGCTNRIDILDPAIIRPGRLDRIIEVGNPDLAGIEQIFTIHTKKMSLDSKITKNLTTIIKKMEGMSGAEIKAVCTEAGYLVLRQKEIIDLNLKLKKIDLDLQKCLPKIEEANTEIKNLEGQILSIDQEISRIESLPIFRRLITEIKGEGADKLIKEKKVVENKYQANKVLIAELKVNLQKTNEQKELLNTKRSLLDNSKNKIIGDLNKKIKITQEDIDEAIKKVKKEEKNPVKYKQMFG